MLKPVIGQMVKVKAADLKVGMKISHDDQIVTLAEVEIDYCEEYAVSYIYEDVNGKLWSGYDRIDTVKSVKYAPGQNLVNIL
ncbi:hypothetical protein [Citrobacter phage Tr1]|nr:hypothetical protein [Citrobacter phage Tr1]